MFVVAMVMVEVLLPYKKPKPMAMQWQERNSYKLYV
jgi:hypothetical protein